MTGFLVLGGVFLCATGAEALYADMGHFGPRPIRFAWYGLVLPTLLLNYAGQAAVVVDGAVEAGANPFFVLSPSALQVPWWRLRPRPPSSPAKPLSAAPFR
jgi:KUP system potassium uptake protein